MKKKYNLIICLALLLGMVSCETTGDPNKGGYLGWSRSKAQDRQDNLRDELDFSRGEGNELRAENRSLETRKANLRNQIADATRQSRTASNPQEKKNADLRIADLNRQLRTLEAL